MSTIKETAYCELVGTDEKVDQNEWGGSVNIPIKAEGQGIIIRTVLLRQGYDKAAGAALSGTGYLVLFRGNPSITSGTGLAALTRTQVNQIIAIIAIANTDWHGFDDVGTDASTIAVLHMASNEGDIYVPRLADTELYAAVLWTLATSINSGGTDEEDLNVKLIYD